MQALARGHVVGILVVQGLLNGLEWLEELLRALRLGRRLLLGQRWIVLDGLRHRRVLVHLLRLLGLGRVLRWWVLLLLILLRWWVLLLVLLGRGILLVILLRRQWLHELLLWWLPGLIVGLELSLLIYFVLEHTIKR